MPTAASVPFFSLCFQNYLPAGGGGVEEMYFCRVWMSPTCFTSLCFANWSFKEILLGREITSLGRAETCKLPLQGLNLLHLIFSVSLGLGGYSASQGSGDRI